MIKCLFDMLVMIIVFFFSVEENHTDSMKGNKCVQDTSAET